MPVRNDLSDSEEVLSHPYFGIFLDQIKTSKARTAHPACSQMDSIITDAGQLIMRKEMTPKQALDDAAVKIDALLTK
jgi:multiple sugar transport system substrate-binding protein